MQYVQYERKESIFESLTDLNLITLIIKSLFFSMLRFPTWEFLHLFNSNEEMILMLSRFEHEKML